MKKTSLKAWEKVRKKLTKRQMEVFNKVYDLPGITIREAANKLRTFPHCISGRFSELEELGVIKTEGVKKFHGSNIPHSKYYINKKKVRV